MRVGCLYALPDLALFVNGSSLSYILYHARVSLYKMRSRSCIVRMVCHETTDIVDFYKLMHEGEMLPVSGLFAHFPCTFGLHVDHSYFTPEMRSVRVRSNLSALIRVATGYLRTLGLSEHTVPWCALVLLVVDQRTTTYVCVLLPLGLIDTGARRGSHGNFWLRPRVRLCVSRGCALRAYPKAQVGVICLFDCPGRSMP